MLRWVTLSTPTSNLLDAHVEAQRASPLGSARGDLVGFQNSIKTTDLHGLKPRFVLVDQPFDARERPHGQRPRPHPQVGRRGLGPRGPSSTPRCRCGPGGIRAGLLDRPGPPAGMRGYPQDVQRAVADLEREQDVQRPD